MKTSNLIPVLAFSGLTGLALLDGCYGDSREEKMARIGTQNNGVTTAVQYLHDTRADKLARIGSTPNSFRTQPTIKRTLNEPTPTTPKPTEDSSVPNPTPTTNPTQDSFASGKYKFYARPSMPRDSGKGYKYIEIEDLETGELIRDPAKPNEILKLKGSRLEEFVSNNLKLLNNGKQLEEACPALFTSAFIDGQRNYREMPAFKRKCGPYAKI